MDTKSSDSFLDEFLFLISTIDPWHGDLIIYLQTQIFHPNISHDDRRCIHHHAKYYLILNDTLYRHGIDTILRRCLTHTEVDKFLMTAILGHVAVIFLGWLQLRKSFVLAISGLLFLNIVTRLLRNSHLVNAFI